MLKRKLKILFTILYFPPAWGYGGPVKVAYNYAKELVARGHKVTVYTTDTLDNVSRIYRKHNILEGIEVIYLSNISNFLASKKIFLTPSFPFLIKKTIKNFDLVHCFDFRNLQNIAVNYFAIKNQVPYCLSVFGQINRGRGLLSMVKFCYDVLSGRRILKYASCIFAQNDHEEQTIAKQHIKKEKIAKLPLAIDLSEFQDLPQKGEFRKKYGINENDFLMLFVGRIHYLKGIDTIIKALPGIKKKIRNVKLVIVGRDDGYLSQIRILTKAKDLERSVIFAGPVYEKERISIYRDTNIFIITPRFPEETSLASLEAAACGIPIIVNQNCQVPHLANYNGGITLKDDNADTLVNAVYDLHKNEKSAGEMAKKMVDKEYSIEKVVNTLEKIYYGQVLGGKP